MKLLVLTTNGTDEASTHYRIAQYVDALGARGHRVWLSAFYAELPLPGRPLAAKVGAWAAGITRQLRASLSAGRYDAVIVQRSIYPTRFGDLSQLVRAPILYDFDDALWLADSDAGVCARLCERADQVIAGNAYLAAYARQTGRRVEVVPTVVDTDRFVARAHVHAVPRVGWIGSPSTFPFLEPLLPMIDDLARQHRFIFRVVGAPRPLRLRHVEIEQPAWSRASEPTLFAELDIGLYPLADDAWSLGKCGLKSIQYMASGVAHIAAPIGVVREISEDGRTALWASDADAWRTQLVRLLGDPDLRERLQAAARARVVEAYSLQRWAPVWLRLIEEIAGTRRRAPR